MNDIADYNLNEWVFEWLERYKKIMVKRSTYDSYVTYMSHIKCTVKIKELKSYHVQDMINNMVSDGLALSTIKHMLTLVRQSMRKARNLGLVDNLNMLEDLELPRATPKLIESFDDYQYRLIMENAHKYFYGDVFRALLLTGCRVGELISLRWRDIDLFSKQIYITNTTYKHELQPCKTDKSCRAIPMYEELEKIITKRYSPFKQSNDRVFVNTLGRPIVYRTLLNCWERFLNDIGIYNIVGLHACRHTFAHRALRLGVPAVVVARWLGHSDVTITLKYYDNVDRNDMKRAADLLQQACNE